jgi:hypothetical protein
MNAINARRVNEYILQSLAHEARRETTIDLIVWGIVILAAIGVADVVLMAIGH